MITRRQINESIDEAYYAQYKRLEKANVPIVEFMSRIEELAVKRIIEALTELDKALAHQEALKK